MATTAEGRTPVHLWIVGILSLLWHGYGCYDYFMTETANKAYLAKVPPEIIAYIHGFPAWLTASWAIGVWGGLAGAVLLLLRSRYSVWGFGLSLIGAIVGLGYQGLAMNLPAASMRTIYCVIIVIAVFLFWYAWTMQKKGVLR